MSTFTFTDLAVTGSFTNSGTSTGNRRAVTSGTTVGPTALTAAQSGLVNIATAASGNQTWTLPSAATAGLIYTFICGNAGGEILVNPITAQTISIKASEGGANVTTAGGTGIKNTAATNVLNDQVTLVSDGVTGWWMIAQSGTWASQ